MASLKLSNNGKHQAAGSPIHLHAPHPSMFVEDSQPYLYLTLRLKSLQHETLQPKVVSTF
jgi:hypothetical protein